MKSAVVSDCGGFGRFLCCSVECGHCADVELGGGVDFDHSAQNEPAVDTIPTYKHTRHSQGSSRDLQ